LNCFIAGKFLSELEDWFCYTEVIANCEVQVLVMRSVLCRAHRNVAVQIAAHDGEIAVVILGSVVVNIAELIGVLCSGSILMFAERNIE
jgi:hypothetical protein